MVIDLSNKDILVRLKNFPSVLEFMESLKQDEKESLAMMLSWPPRITSRFKNDPDHLSVLHKVWDLVPDKDSFLNAYFAVCDNPDSASVNILDAFSKGQLDSKQWLIDVVSNHRLNLGKIWILCGWIGTLAQLMFVNKGRVSFDLIRSFDVDPRCAFIAETLNRRYVKDGWLFKATTMDVNELAYDDMVYLTKRYDGTEQAMCESADTVINTSCDHMGRNDNWWASIPAGKLVILQNNDYVSNEQHDGCVLSLREFEERYHMSRFIYTGEIQCQLYRRFMLIGIK